MHLTFSCHFKTLYFSSPHQDAYNFLALLSAVVKTTMFSTLEYKSGPGERGRPLCMHSGVVWTMGRRGKKHTCLQINWFGQEASKEELCVVKQACGEAGMSQQKHHHDHREDHHTSHARFIISRFTYAVLADLQIDSKTS